ncbi:MAG: YciI family protein [Myxococcota bacterium]
MPLFVYTGTDGPRGLELRPSVRPRHLAHLEALAAAGRIRFAGPLIGEDEEPCGSVIVFEADDWAAARALAEGDPYLLEGVFERVEVRETKQVLPAEG